MNKPFKYRLAIGAVFKNESHVLKEWLDYYLKAGVEHFYLVNNNSTDDYGPILKFHADRVTLFHDTRHPCQLQAYNELILPASQKEAEWLLVVDLDEFVYNPQGSPISTVLERYRHFGGVSSPWIFFGSNQHDSQPISIISGFTKRMYYGTGKQVNVKNFYQTRYLKQLYPHHAEFDSRQFVVSSKSHTRIANGRDWVSENDLTFDRFDFLTNHYAIQSREWFMRVKVPRGDVHSSRHDQLRNEEYFSRYDHNEVIDRRLDDIVNASLESYQLVLCRPKEITDIIIGFPTPQKQQIRRRLAERFGLSVSDRERLIGSSYYDEMVVYESTDLLSQISTKFNHAQVWILTDTTRHILYSYYRESPKTNLEDFREVYQRELDQVERGTPISQTKLLKYGDTENYIKRAKKFFPKLKTVSVCDFIDYEVNLLSGTTLSRTTSRKDFVL
jgi:hypothetical protein